MDKKKKNILYIAVCAVLIVVFAIINIKLNSGYKANNEWLNTVECSRIINDNYGNKIRIEFDAHSEKEGLVNICFYNELLGRHGLYHDFNMTASNEHYQFGVFVDWTEETDTFLNFNSASMSGIWPNVTNIEITKCE